MHRVVVGEQLVIGPEPGRKLLPVIGSVDQIFAPE